MDDITLFAEFAETDVREDGDDVVLSGPLFRAGDYPAVKFALSPREVLTTIKQFIGPKPMDLEHDAMTWQGVDGAQYSIEGQVGQIEKVWSDEDGEWIYAEARKPKWLHNLMPERRVSATFSRVDKSLVGAAWTASPRVQGAELYAAFAESTIGPTGPVGAVGAPGAPVAPGPAGPNNLSGLTLSIGDDRRGLPFTSAEFAKANSTSTGQMHMQMLHDETVRRGAVCDRGNAQMASRKEAGAIQQAHDLFASNGARCEAHTDGTNQSGEAMPMPLFAVQPPAPQTPVDTPRRRIRMNITDLFRKMAKDADVELEGTDEELLSQFSKPALDRADELAAEIAKRDARIAELEKTSEAKFALAEAERRESVAATFARDQIDAGRLTPEALEPTVALHNSIAASTAVVTFAEGEKSTLVLFEEFVASLPNLAEFARPNVETGDRVLNTTDATPGVPGAEAAEPTAEEIDKYLGMTPLGRDILAARSA